MTAVEEYQEWASFVTFTQGSSPKTIALADAALAEETARADQAEADRDGWADSFKQAEAALHVKEQEWLMVLGSIVGWVDKLPKELGAAIEEGKVLARHDAEVQP